MYATKESRLELLTKVLSITTDTLEKDNGDEGQDDVSDDERPAKKAVASRTAVRRKANIADLSGAGGLLYTEYTAKSTPSAPAAVPGEGACAAAGGLPAPIGAPVSSVRLQQELGLGAGRGRENAAIDIDSD